LAEIKSFFEMASSNDLNLVNIMSMRCSAMIPHFVSTWQKTWPLWATFVFDMLKLEKYRSNWFLI